MKFVGVVLTGGQSRRMGRDKATLEIKGRPLLEQTIEKLSEICNDIVVANGPAGSNIPSSAISDRPDVSLVDDLDGLKGPAAGIIAAARARPGRALLVVACDLPNITCDLLTAIAESPGDWVVPRQQDRLEPLCSLYRTPALSALRRRAANGDFALHRLVDEDLAIKYFEGSDFDGLGDPPALFLNLNTPSDLAGLEGLT